MKRVVGLALGLVLVLSAACSMNKVNARYLEERSGYTDFNYPIYAWGTVVGFGTLVSENENVPGTKFVAVRYHSVAYKSPSQNALYKRDYLVRYAMKDSYVPSLAVGQEVSLGFIVMKNDKKPRQYDHRIRKINGKENNQLVHKRRLMS